MFKPTALWPGFALAVLVAVGGLVVIALSQDPALTVRLMRQLGPIDGLRCQHQMTYVYVPGGINVDGGLLRERPEDVLRAADVERVEVNLRTGEAVAWTRGLVYVLEPTQLSMVVDDATSTTVCVSQLAGWQIVGQHALG